MAVLRVRGVPIFVVFKGVQQGTTILGCVLFYPFILDTHLNFGYGSISKGGDGGGSFSARAGFGLLLAQQKE